MKDKIKNYFETCLKCIHNSPLSGKTEGVLHSIPKGQVPLEVLHIDHFGPLPPSGGKKFILVVIDGFSKFTKLYAVKTTSTDEVITCLKEFFSCYSRPKKIISDRGSCFTSENFSEFMTMCNIQHIKTATLTPQANGQVERVNRVLTPMLAKETNADNAKNWHKSLGKVEFALNNTKSRSTGSTPSLILFGVEQRGE